MAQKNSPFLISVIIPAYNIEPYIETCIDSLEKQTLLKDMFEVIIVDDCSTDKTLSKIRAYPTNLNLQIPNLEKNAGPGIARNKGMSLAKGKYLLFLDWI